MTTDKPSTLLVTGGAHRIGRGIALAAAARGMDVAVHYRHSAEEAQALVSDIRGMGRRSAAVQGDFASTGAAGAVMAAAQEALGPITALVNSASSFRESGLMDFDLGELESEVRVNAYAPLLLCRAFSEQTTEGVIVNLLDSRMNSYDKLHVAYHLSKRMLYDVTRMLAIELAPRFRVNAVAPGLILPPAGEPESYLEDHKHENPLLRYGSVEEIAEAVMFLVESRFVTGQTIFVDGGRHLKSAVYG